MTRHSILVTAVAAVMAIALPVAAADRPDWGAELWFMEEGEVLVASVTSMVPTGDALAPTLALMCGGRGSYRLRYDPGPQADDGVDWTGRSAVFAFDAGTVHLERELQFEAMDAMWAMSLPAGDALIGAIQAGDVMTVAMPGGGFGENTFSLKGSSKAIAEMRRSC